MPFETFAQRRRREQRSGQPEIYTYDSVPPYLRHQINEALAEGIGRYKMIDSTGFDDYRPDSEYVYDCWKEIDRTCRKEIEPYLDFVENEEDNLHGRVAAAITNIEDVNEWLSVVEICCIVLSNIVVAPHLNTSVQEEAQEALAELNRRFEQHQIGYQFENGRIIRQDSKLVHAELIKPALALLTASYFSKANADFMTAHEHYRTGAYPDAVTAANRAFESMMKAICDLEGWAYKAGDTAARLVTVLRTNGHFTHDFDAGFDAYVAMMKTGLPTVRNNAGGHGQGLAAAGVTAAIARYAISMTAANLIFLSSSYDAMKASRP